MLDAKAAEQWFSHYRGEKGPFFREGENDEGRIGSMTAGILLAVWGISWAQAPADQPMPVGRQLKRAAMMAELKRMYGSLVLDDAETYKNAPPEMRPDPDAIREYPSEPRCSTHLLAPKARRRAPAFYDSPLHRDRACATPPSACTRAMGYSWGLGIWDGRGWLSY